MVLSRINESIEYPSAKYIEPEDVDYEAQLYQIELFGDLEVIIALGNVRYTYIDNNILYIPVYLTHDGEVLVQIGVYEFNADIYTSLLDEDNDFDISLLENPLPLLYKFVTESFTRKETGQKASPVKMTPVKESSFDDGAEEAKDADDTDADDTDDTDDTDVDADDADDTDYTGYTDADDANDAGETKGTPKGISPDLLKDSRVPNTQTILEELVEEDDDEKAVVSKIMLDKEDEQVKQFSARSGQNWLNKYMRNEKYEIIDNEGGGDCLFAVIRDAFSGIGKNVSVLELRTIASDSATQQTFLNFKEQYDMYSTVVQEYGLELSIITNNVDSLKRRVEKTKDRNIKKQAVEQAKPLIKEFKSIKKNKRVASELLYEYRWMRGVNNLQDLKVKIKTCGFWAESWAINVLEMALNVKMIILSSENYSHGDYDNVLQCGEMVSSKVEDSGEFKPKYYIILDHTGQHYKLVTYEQKRIFTFNDIPIHLKKMVVNKCLERDSGIYNFIPKFKALKQQMVGLPMSLIYLGDDVEFGEGSENINAAGEGEEKGEGEGEEKAGNGAELSINPEFDDTTVFQFYAKSSNKPLPGKGSGEKISVKNRKKYTELASILGWRKILSNFYMAPFKLDDRSWNSVEHYYHGNKFKNENPAFYEEFTIESNSDISKDPAFAKAAGDKIGKYKLGKWKRAKDVTIDNDFFSSGRDRVVMKNAQAAKFQQIQLAKDVLLATHNAKLQHHVRAQPAVVFYDMMSIRDILSKKV